jgi:predicted lipoprotein with Yx(FWY)xxD motif
MRTINLRTFLLGLAGGALVAAVLMAGTAAAGSTAASVISTAKTPLGRVLVDSRGHTLYLFEKDRNGMSACSGACAQYWPPLTTTRKPVARGGARASMLGTTKRADGKLQVTYAGHPLYTFKLDAKKGQTRGEGSDNFGAEWYVVGTNGSKIEKPAASTSTGGSGSGGYGSGGGYGS